MSLLSKLAAVTTLAIIFYATTAKAADDPQQVAAADSGKGGLEEVTVTARRRDESILRVPVSVTALGAEQLNERVITTQQDLQIAVPGLLVRETNNSNDNNYVIRGQSLEGFSGMTPAVMPYLNDVQLLSGGSALIYDLDSVQVLKGPQGTLFGRNTTGGAVLFSTAKPGNELGGFATVRAGNYSLGQFTGAVDLPIVTDRVLLRVAADIRTRSGWQRNIFNGDMLGADRHQSGRATLLLKPTDAIENTSVFQYDRVRGTSTTGELWSVNTPGQVGPDGAPLNAAAAGLYNPTTFNSLFGAFGGWNAFLAAHPGLPNVAFADYVALDRQNGTKVAGTDMSLTNEVNNRLFTNTTTFKIHDDMRLKNIFGYGQVDSFQVSDFDGTPFPITPSVPFPGQTDCTAVSGGANPVCPDGDTLNLRQISEELQLSGTAHTGIDYLLGLYYSRDEQERFSGVGFFDLRPFAPPVLNTAFNQRVSKNTAIFGQATFDIGALGGPEGMHFAMGVRESREVIDFKQLFGSQFYSTYGAAPEESVTNRPSWTASLDYQITPSTMLYVVSRHSWRSGGYNGSSDPVNATPSNGGNYFAPEIATDVEVGAKFGGHVGEMPVRASVAAFNQWVRDAQHNIYYAVGDNLKAGTSNVPRVRISGVEFDSSLRPTDWLEIGANGAYLNAAFTDNRVAIFDTVLHFGPRADSPRWTGSTYARVAFPLQKLGEFSLRGDLYTQSSFYFSNLASTIVPNTRLPCFSVFNARAELRNVAGTRLSLALYGKNLFDRAYYVGGLPEGAGFGGNYALAGEPRTFGGEFSVSF